MDERTGVKTRWCAVCGRGGKTTGECCGHPTEEGALRDHLETVLAERTDLLKRVAAATGRTFIPPERNTDADVVVDAVRAVAAEASAQRARAEEAEKRAKLIAPEHWRDFTAVGDLRAALEQAAREFRSIQTAAGDFTAPHSIAEAALASISRVIGEPA